MKKLTAEDLAAIAAMKKQFGRIEKNAAGIFVTPVQFEGDARAQSKINRRKAVGIDAPTEVQ